MEIKKKILLNYDDIKLDNLLEFIGIEESEIKPMQEEMYEEFFNENLKLDVITMIKNYFNSTNTQVNYVTPEVIINSMKFSDACGSKILEYYAGKYNLLRSYLFFFDHHLFKALEKYMLISGIISEKGKNKSKEQSSLFGIITNPQKHSIMEKFDANQPNKTMKIDSNIWNLLDTIKTKFIGQEEAVEDLFYNIVNNQRLAEMPDILDGQRSRWSYWNGKSCYNKGNY